MDAVLRSLSVLPATTEEASAAPPRAEPIVSLSAILADAVRVELVVWQSAISAGAEDAFTPPP